MLDTGVAGEGGGAEEKAQYICVCMDSLSSRESAVRVCVCVWIGALREKCDDSTFRVARW